MTLSQIADVLAAGVVYGSWFPWIDSRHQALIPADPPEWPIHREHLSILLNPMTQPTFATPQQAAMSGFSAKHCRVVATAVDGNDAYVVIDTGSDGFSYLYGGTAQRERDGWRDGTSGNGDGWISTDPDRDLGVLAVWDEAPAGCDAVRVQWRGEIREAAVQDGAYLVTWFKVPCPEDSWPSVTSLRIGGRWVP